MITIDLGDAEYYDSDKNQFEYDKGGIVRFEYSLKSLYNWEGKWKKPFLKGELTDEELIDFYMSMSLDPIKRHFLTDEVMETLSKYIGDLTTATTFSTPQKDGNGFTRGKIYTSEELYALMFEANVPLEFENRNLNRLLVILRIISNHNTPPKKMSIPDILRQNAQLNAARKKQMNTRG